MLPAVVQPHHPESPVPAPHSHVHSKRTALVLQRRDHLMRCSEWQDVRFVNSTRMETTNGVRLTLGTP